MPVTFEIDLGHGWFIDSSGRLHRSPTSFAPIYKTSSILPFTAKDLENLSTVLKAVGRAMPDKNDPKSVEAFKNFGFSKETINFLASVGAVAGTVNQVVGIVAALVVVAMMVVNFTQEETGANKELQNVKAELESFSKSIADMMKLDFVVQVEDVIPHALDAIQTFTIKFRDYKPKPEELKAELDKLHLLADKVESMASQTTNVAKWVHPYSDSEYPPWQPWLQNLFLYPEGAEAPVLAPTLTQGLLRFDHRLAVPFALYSLAAYLVLIKTIAPEYRTTGQFSPTLKRLAGQTSKLAAAIREFNLARTIYRPEDFFVLLDPPKFFGPPGVYSPGVEATWGSFGPLPWANTRLLNFSGGDPGLDPYTYVVYWGYTVGGVDLAAYTNGFLRRPAVTTEEWHSARLGKSAIKRGDVELLWWPGMQPDSKRRVRVAKHSALDTFFETRDPEESAAEANDASQRDYTQLLISSGYLQLVHQAACLRHLYAEPDSSETVAHVKASYSHQFKAHETIVVTTGPIPLTKVPITSSARRDKQGFRVRNLVTTQPVGRDNGWKVAYRVVLRSIDSDDYASVYHTRYVNEVPNSALHVDEKEADPTFKTLVVDVNKALIKDEFVLAQRLENDDRGSPATLVSAQGTKKLKVTTFDWYVPVRWLDFTVRPEGTERVARAVAATGWTEESAVPIPATVRSRVISLGEEILSHSDEMGMFGAEWRTARSEVLGERRNLREETCTVNWSIRWEAERLVVVIEGRPEDRNCVLFLVVEERLKRSEQFLHTVFPVPLNTQITSVPIEFFEEEKAAWKQFEEASRAAFDTVRGLALQGGLAAVRQLLDGYEPREFVLKFGIEELIGRYKRGM